jgi:hypothetical protein
VSVFELIVTVIPDPASIDGLVPKPCPDVDCGGILRASSFCGVNRNLTYRLVDASGTPFPLAYALSESFSNLSTTNSLLGLPTPVVNAPIPANGYVTDAQFVGFNYPKCLASNDHHSYTQKFSVLVGETTFNLSSLPPVRQDRQVPPALQEDFLTRATRIGDVSLPASSAFEAVLLEAGVPGGEALVPGCSDEPDPIVHPKGKSLQEVLDSIIVGDSRYIWTVKEGVANLKPRRGVPPLLRTRLKNYDSRDFADPASAITFLSSSPAVTRAASKIGLQQNVVVGALRGVDPGPLLPKSPLGIRLQNVTLLDALNAIVRASKHGVWSYRETHCGATKHCKPMTRHACTRTCVLLSYLAFLLFSALNFAQRAFVAFEILALAAADIVRLRVTSSRLANGTLDGAGCEPFRARMAPCIPFSCFCSLACSCLSATKTSINSSLGH